MTEVAAMERDTQAEEAAAVHQALRYWLATEDVYISPYVREWLAKTDRCAAVDTLFGFALHAASEPRSIFRMMINGYMVVFSSSEIVRDNTPGARKAGKRAALLLASMGDLRSLQPLVNAFEAHWFWQGSYQTEIEKALLKLLSNLPPSANLSAQMDNLVKLANIIWKLKSRITERQAEILIQILPLLRANGSVTDMAILKKIASCNSKSKVVAMVVKTSKQLLC